MANFFIDLSMAALRIVQDLILFLFVLGLAYVILNFIIKLLKKEQFRAVNVEAYKDWVAVTRNTYSKTMRNLWIVGTKRMSEFRINKIFGYAQAYLPAPDAQEFKGDKKAYKAALAAYEKEKRMKLDRLHIFAVRKWWNLLDPMLLYVIPEPLLVDDALVGDIFINCAGFLPVLHYWRVPSNLNRKRYVDAIKTNSIYIGYEQDWDYIGNIAQRAIEAENQFLKAKGIKESILGIFGKKDAGERK